MIMNVEDFMNNPAHWTHEQKMLKELERQTALLEKLVAASAYSMSNTVSRSPVPFTPETQAVAAAPEKLQTRETMLLQQTKPKKDKR